MKSICFTFSFFKDICHFHNLTFSCIFAAMVYCYGQKLYGEGSITIKRQSAFWIGRLMVMALSLNIFLVMAHLQLVTKLMNLSVRLL